MPIEQGKIMKKRKHEGKMRDKWPKRAWENREKSAHQTYLNRTRGTQQIKHQLVINGRTRNTKCQTTMFSSSLIDENSNKGAIDELEIFDHH